MPPNSATRWLPFVSSDLKDYLNRYWAVMFTVGARPIETGHIRHYVSWYCTRMKVVLLDHHVYVEPLRQQLQEVSRTPELPLLFVNKKLVGTLRDVELLEREKKLKDVLHFGFEWRVGGSVAATNGQKSLMGALPAPYGDAEFFRGRYRGPPVARPVVSLPTLHPFALRSEE
ncbi:uncharacterized protein TEOVI_000092500 [Trypanosoma equiperdum]|uniref:Glutaredoxin domain-containing protein n=2 Tax=Trypanozoon TaxID=39700 RepID=Q57VU7_TRYB2|nr:hypothetical protein, conserved [Trypanosoma brucei brucei TREU927]AAX70272.1 hypothetical protein, conserved [Trypanosoma brucei]AAZ12166.1 hypothetical protein, conserved [Trypanosoma brucei brucei TREU927]SCU69359.1 hypothetical protein, conserved [Trypanosoma equiperdum]